MPATRAGPLDADSSGDGGARRRGFSRGTATDSAPPLGHPFRFLQGSPARQISVSHDTSILNYSTTACSRVRRFLGQSLEPHSVHPGGRQAVERVTNLARAAPDAALIVVTCGLTSRLATPPSGGRIRTGGCRQLSWDDQPIQRRTLGDRDKTQQTPQINLKSAGRGDPLIQPRSAHRKDVLHPPNPSCNDLRESSGPRSDPAGLGVHGVRAPVPRGCTCPAGHRDQCHACVRTRSGPGILNSWGLSWFTSCSSPPTTTTRTR